MKQSRKSSGALFTFLSALQSDAGLQAAFETEPEATLERAGLSAAERAVLQAGPEAVAKHLRHRAFAMTAMTGVVRR